MSYPPILECLRTVVANLIVRFEERNCRASPNPIAQLPERNRKAFANLIGRLRMNPRVFANLIDQLKEPNARAAANPIVLNSSWKAVASLTARMKEPKELNAQAAASPIVLGCCVESEPANLTARTKEPNARAAASPIVLGLSWTVVASLTARTKEQKELNVRAAANPIGLGLSFESEPANLTALECSASPFLARRNQAGCYSKPDWSFEPNRLD
jgi:hypothetical protein